MQNSKISIVLILIMIVLFILFNFSEDIMDYFFGNKESFYGTYADYLAMKDTIQLAANQGKSIQKESLPTITMYPTDNPTTNINITQENTVNSNSTISSNSPDSNYSLPTNSTLPPFSQDEIMGLTNEVFKYSNVVPSQKDIFSPKISSYYSVVSSRPINNINGGNAFPPSNAEIALICNSLQPTDCINSSLCVLSGNSNSNKCVPGNINGPRTHFEDVNIDYYYYQNLCYGNCPGKLYSVTVPSSSITSNIGTLASSSIVSDMTSTPTDNSPTDNSPTDNSPTDNSPTDTSPTDNSPTDNSPTDKSSTDNL
jgi:hypothetical protein